MIPHAFEYERPETVAEAVGLLAGSGDGARVLAGGHSLLPMMKLRLASPGMLVDIGRIPELRGIRETADGIAIGAMTTHAEVAASEIVRRDCPLLAAAAAGIGDMQVRARGTIGGALAQADSHADLPAVLLALDGEVTTEGPSGSRTIAAGDLFVGYLTTSLAPDEILTGVRVRKTAGGAYLKFNRRAQDWAIVGVAAIVDGPGARIGITGAGPKAIRATAAEEAFASGGAEAAAAHAADGLRPVSDTAGSDEYRKHLAGVLTRRALEQAAG